jgi:hypothetical protein
VEIEGHDSIEGGIMKVLRPLSFVAVLAAFLLLLGGCGGKGLGSKFRDMAKKKKSKTHFEIYQPHHIYKEDKVLIWHTPGRKKRKFLLAPGTRVKVLKTVNGEPYGTPHDMYYIRTADGREGWVPSGWCKEKKGK